jgi:hypothetical protein
VLYQVVILSGAEFYTVHPARRSASAVGKRARLPNPSSSQAHTTAATRGLRSERVHTRSGLHFPHFASVAPRFTLGHDWPAVDGWLAAIRTLKGELGLLCIAENAKRSSSNGSYAQPLSQSPSSRVGKRDASLSQRGHRHRATQAPYKARACHPQCLLSFLIADYHFPPFSSTIRGVFHRTVRYHLRDGR